MMRQKRAWLRALVPLLGMLLLLFHSEAAAQAAREGVVLCLKQLIPSLFPFMVLTELVLSLGLDAPLGRLFAPLTRRLLHLEGAAAIPFLLGLIGGFPLGARAAVRLYREGRIPRETAESLLAFCNNCGFGFLIGFAGAGILKSPGAGLVLWLSQLMAALLTGALLRPPLGTSSATGDQAPPVPSTAAAFTGAVRAAGDAALGVSYFVVFFSVVAAMWEAAGVPDLFIAPSPLARTLFRGFWELSGGVAALAEMQAPLWLRAAVTGLLVGWSGCSVHFQVLALTADTPLSLGKYALGKLLTALLTALFSALGALLLTGTGFVGLALPKAGLPLFLSPLPLVLLVIFRQIGTGKEKNRGV